MNPVDSVYQQSTIGVALNQTLEIMTKTNKIGEGLAKKVQQCFDLYVKDQLKKTARAKIIFTAEKMVRYTYLNYVWRIILKNVEIREFHGISTIKKLTIIGAEDNPRNKRKQKEAKPKQPKQPKGKAKRKKTGND